MEGHTRKCAVCASGMWTNDTEKVSARTLYDDSTCNILTVRAVYTASRFVYDHHLSFYKCPSYVLVRTRRGV